jgi:hypothetical protein
MEQASPYCLVWNSHKCPANTAANWGLFAEQTSFPNNSVALHLIMVQRDGEKWSWRTSGGYTLIGIDWHPFGVLEADSYCQNYCWQFGNKLIFINYMFMKKNEFNLLYTTYARTFNGSWSCLLAWWQIPHSLALLGQKRNNLTSWRYEMKRHQDKMSDSPTCKQQNTVKVEEAPNSLLSLPMETLQYCISFVGKGHYQFVGSICKQINKIYANEDKTWKSPFRVMLL